MNENDFRDMQTFQAVVPYADYIVAENQFSNLAIQAGLAKKYGPTISTDILSLEKLVPLGNQHEQQPSLTDGAVH